MSILTYCRDACSKHAALLGVILTVLVGILSTFENLRRVGSSYVGLHNHVPDNKNGYDDSAASGYGLYMTSGKDIFTVLALHLPLFFWCSMLSDVIKKFQTRQLGDTDNKFQIRCHGMSALMLFLCFLLNICTVSKEGYWTQTSLWWNGLPEGRMPFLVKLNLIVHLTVLCYWLESVWCSKQSLIPGYGEAFHRASSLIFGIVCYSMNFSPLAMVTLLGRVFMECLVCCMQMMSLMTMTGKLSQGLRFFTTVVHRWLAISEVISYWILALATVFLGSRGVYAKALIVAVFAALFASSVFRMVKGGELALQQTLAPGSGDPQSKGRAKKVKSKSGK